MISPIIYDDETDEELAAKLQAIADTVMPGIKVEEDLPGRHPDKCLPILDMKVWLDENGHLYHKHYQKPMASNLVISARSAHPTSTKRAIHIAELVRRLLNTSRDLDWDQYVAPVLSEYMARMKAAGYNEDYRKHCLQHALKIYDAKLRDNDNGVSPLNRLPGFRKVERRKEKQQKRKGWSQKGGYTAPIIIPATPDGILAKKLREVAESEATPGLRLKIVERGGKRLGNVLSKPNPTSSDHCIRKDHPKAKKRCVGCNQNGGISNCQTSNCVYKYECEIDGCSGTYIGETSRNVYTRSLEHSGKYDKNNSDSFILKHQNEYHNGEPANVKVKFVKSFKDAMSRQISEAVTIFKTQEEGKILMNSKSEWRQASMVEMREQVVTRAVGS